MTHVHGSNSEELMHYGIKNQKWGVRRFQYKDGSLTPAGRRRYLEGDKSTNTGAPIVKGERLTQTSGTINKTSLSEHPEIKRLTQTSGTINKTSLSEHQELRRLTQKSGAVKKTSLSEHPELKQIPSGIESVIDSNGKKRSIPSGIESIISNNNAKLSIPSGIESIKATKEERERVDAVLAEYKNLGILQFQRMSRSW